MRTALVIESPPPDPAGQRQSIMGVLARHTGWSAEQVAVPDDALARLDDERFEVVLADAEAVRDRDDWLSAVRDGWPNLPVILVAADGRDEATVKALVLGAATFVPRSAVARDLVGTVERVLALCGHGKAIDPGGCLTETVHTYTLSADRGLIPGVLCHVQGELDRFEVCSRADRLRVAVALEEAVTNAVIHGNLEVSSTLRERGDDAFESAIAARRQTAPYKDRIATLAATFRRSVAEFVVSDQGPGFNPQTLPDPTDPENLVKPHGRGLLLMRTFMDEVRHNDRGNVVTLVKRAVKRAGT